MKSIRPSRFVRSMIFPVFLALLLADLLCGCMKSEKVAGGTSETTNGQYSALVTNSDGTPAANALVLFIDGEDWYSKAGEHSSVILDSARTRSDGRVMLKRPGIQRCNLQIDLETEALFVPDYMPASTDTGILKLVTTRKATLSGHIKSGLKQLREMRLAGTQYEIQAGADSAFSFAGTAPGRFTLVAVVYRNGSVTAESIQTVDLKLAHPMVNVDVYLDTTATPDTTKKPDTTLVKSKDQVLVNDFEQPDWSKTPIGSLAGGSWNATPIGAATIQSSASAGLAYAGKSLFTTVTYSSDPGLQSGQVGFTLAKTINLTKMDTISTYAMGNGQVTLVFHSRSLDSTSGGRARFEYTFNLPPGPYAEVLIPVDSLKFNPNLSRLKAVDYPWPTVAKDILSVQFATVQPTDTSETMHTFWLDNFMFRGVSPQGLME